MKILVVEDDAISRKVVTTILEKEGYEVVASDSGKEAVSLLGQHHDIDAVVSDVMMPVMDGFHLLAYMKADPSLANIPVMLCSALSDAGSVRKGILLGVADYITKPINAESMIAKIKKMEKSLPASVLLVNEEEMTRNLLERILVREGYRVTQASSGQDALKKIESGRISMVLTGYAMPEMDGLELLNKIKQDRPKLPVLIVSNSGTENSKARSKGKSADGFIVKPFNNTAIVQTIQLLL